MRCPDHVSRAVLSDIAAGKKPDKKYSEAMKSWHAKNSEENPKLSQTAELAFDIHAGARQAEILEALLLSGCPYGEIAEAFNVPEEVTAYYAELFFDVSVFRTGLDRIGYLEDYEDDWGRDLKVKAVNLGYEYVLYNFANLVPKRSSQKKLIERMFMSTAYKAMAMNYNGIKSEVNRQAVKHAELMIKAYDLLAKTNSDDVNEGHDLISLLAVDGKRTGSKKDTPEVGEII